LANANDVDGDALTAVNLSIASGNGVLVDNGDGTWSYTPADNDNADVSFSYTINDALSNVASTATLDITPVNDAPVANNDRFTINEDTTLNGSVLGNDTDLESGFTVVSSTDPVNGELRINPDGTFQYVPDPDFFGIRVAPVQDAPIANTDRIVTNEDTPLVITPVGQGVLANDSDADNDRLTVTTQTEPANGTVTLNQDGTFTYTPDPEFNGIDSFTYLVTDSAGNSDVGTVNVVVNSINDAPVAVNDQYVLNEGSAAILDVISNDFDRDSNFLPGETTVSIVTGPSFGELTVDADGNFRYEHDGTETTSDSFVYQIVDQDGAVSDARVSITIEPVDDPTILGNDELVTRVGQQITVDASILLANDFDNDSALLVENIRIVSQPSSGEVTIEDGQLVVTAGNTPGDIEFEYVVVVDGVESQTARTLVRVDGGLPAPATPAPQTVITESATENNTSNEEQQEDEDDDQQELGAVVNNDDDDDDLISTDSTRSASNDYLDNQVLDPVDRSENFSNETVFNSQYSGATYAYASRLDDLSLLNLRGTVVAAAEKVSEFEATYLAGLVCLVWDDLDSAKQSYLLNGLQIGVPTIVSSAASFLTVGYLAWIIRGGVLLTTFMSSVPAWSSFDILSVIDAADDDESIEEMVDQ